MGPALCGRAAADAVIGLLEAGPRATLAVERRARRRAAEELSSTADWIGANGMATSRPSPQQAARSMRAGGSPTRWTRFCGLCAELPDYGRGRRRGGGRGPAIDDEGRPVETTSELTGVDVATGMVPESGERRQRGRRDVVEDVAPDPLLARLGGGEDARTVGFTAPIQDAKGRMLGVWTSRFDFRVVEGLADELQEHLGARGLSTARVLLASGDGVVLHAGDGNPAVGTRLGDTPVVRQALEPDAAGSAESAALDGGGGKVLAGYHRSTGASDFAGLGWTVLTTQDVDEATRPAAALIRRTA